MQPGHKELCSPCQIYNSTGMNSEHKKGLGAAWLAEFLQSHCPLPWAGLTLEKHPS